ncbi:MAG: IMP dehydrogenase, partial [Giesbergeria sp.]
MHIDRDIKLDFRDVLIRPKRSALPSRAEVDITREFVFKHSGRRYRGVPVIAANMDTVGTFAMARALAPFGLATALHKHYGGDELAAFFKGLKLKSSAFYSLGITRSDLDKFERVLQRAGSAIHYVCIDVANG